MTAVAVRVTAAVDAVAVKVTAAGVKVTATAAAALLCLHMVEADTVRMHLVKTHQPQRFVYHPCPPPHTQHPPVVQTSDAERIGVDQVAKILASGKATGTEQRECGAAQQPEAEAVLTGVWWALQQPDSACRGVLGRQACKAWSDSRVTPGGGCSAL